MQALQKEHLTLIKNENKQNSLAENFLDGFASNETQRNYHQAIKSFFNTDDINKVDLNSVKAITVDGIKNFIKNQVSQGKSKKTIENRIYALSSFCTYVNEISNYKIQNPFEKKYVKKLLKNNLPKENDLPGKALSKEQIEQLLSVIKEPRDRIMLKIMFVTGIRKSELLNIKWSDFGYDYTTSKWYVKVQGKGRKERIIEIQPHIIEELKDHFEWKLGEIGSSDDKLFNMSSSNVNYLLNKYSKQINNKITPHDCRRTTITLLIDNGCPLVQVRDLAGHASIRQTEEYERKLNQLKNNAGAYMDILKK